MSRVDGRAYVGRFAPSPTGPLHAGSLVAALASWLDARAHNGQWLVRIEDVDGPRCVAGAHARILSQLADLGLVPDATPVYQSARTPLYQNALDRLVAAGHAYACGCSRKDIEDAWQASGQERARHGERVYPGTCRDGLQGKPARAWRLRTANTGTVRWCDRRGGSQQQDVEREVGDFVLRRADGLWAYQLAVVVDDAQQGVTDVVRGQDLTDNTARQILLQGALGLATPRYLHTPLILGANGEKLSKQNGAAPLATDDPLGCLKQAGAALGLHITGADAPTRKTDWLASAVRAWRDTTWVPWPTTIRA